MKKSNTDVGNTPVIVIRGGEGLPGGAPDWVIQADFTLPLLQRFDREVLAQSIQSKGKTTLGKNVMDMHGYLAQFMRTEHNIPAFTYTDLIDLVIEPDAAFAQDWEEIRTILEDIAPKELDFDFDMHVENMGAGQVKGRGAVVALAFLAAGGADHLVERFAREFIQMVVVTYGATGSTGIGLALALQRWLPRVGVTTVFKIAMLAHQPSIAVDRVVRPQVVRSVDETMRMLPGSVLAGGLPGIDEDGVSRFWDDLLQFLPDISANAANADKKAKEDFDDIDFDLASTVLMLMLHYRSDLPERYIAYLLAHAPRVDEAEAIDKIKTYIDSGWLGFSAKDVHGVRRVEVNDFRTLQIEYLRDLLPTLAFLSHQDVTITGSKEHGAWFLKWTEDYEVSLRGSNIVQEILDEAGVETLVELQESVRGHGASYAGLTAYEHKALEGSDEYTLQEVQDYFLEEGKWHQEAWRLASEAFDADKHFEPAKFQPDMHSDYLWTQLVVSPLDLVIRALELMGAVEDPRILAQRQETEDTLQADIAARKESGKKSVRRQPKKKATRKSAAKKA